MGVIRAENQLDKRYISSGCDSYGYGYYYDDGSCYYSGWNAYGRWVLLAVVIVGAFLLFLLFSCITARRRRRMGRNPYPLTGWAGGSGPAYNNQQSYYNQQPAQGYNQGYNQGTYGAPPPAYGQQQQQYGNMPSQPGPIYQGARGGENVYGNDQSKKDNVVR